jgi:aspartate beta-hydroxylase
MEAARRDSEEGSRRRLADADRRLSANPRDLRALIDKGDALTALGDARAAAGFYSVALRSAREGRSVPADLSPDLHRIQAAAKEQALRFEAHLHAGLSQAGFDREAYSARFAQSLDLMAGRKQLYLSQPLFYLFPGLPQIQFQPEGTLPWMTALEDAAADIRAELLELLAGPDLFRPYVERRADRPNADQAGMIGNPDWSALFLWKDGVEQPAVARRCPRTLEALAEVPLCRIPGRTPSILFSRLKPGARIPPHHGLINTRLICHLGLIVPPGSRFRVGNEVREWKAGQTWAFDDTVEHEARNDGAEDRIILIFDVWRPEITLQERALVSAMFQAIDAYGTGGGSWGV